MMKGGKKSGIRGEFHCHNLFSNYMEPSTRFPLDSPMTPIEQLRAAAKKGLDFIFITNHNTTNGYRQLLKCQREHPELRKVKVYQGEEVSAFLSEKRYGHVLGWGLTDEVRRGMTVEETVEEISSQGGVSCAAHPYGLTFGVRDKAELCDMVEVFNSNNIDMYSNMRAYDSARKWRKFGMACSDAHLPGCMGLSVVSVRSENDMDGILKALCRGDFDIERATYNTIASIKSQVQYGLSDTSRLLGSLKQGYGRSVENMARFLIGRFEHNPDELWIRVLTKLLLDCINNISLKANIYGFEDYLSGASFIKRFVRSFMPVVRGRSRRIVRFDRFDLIHIGLLLDRLNSEMSAAGMVPVAKA